MPGHDKKWLNIAKVWSDMARYGQNMGMYTKIQGVWQYLGHLEICNFSASEAPMIKIFDISRKPEQFWFQNYSYFLSVMKICHTFATDKIGIKI